MNPIRFGAAYTMHYVLKGHNAITDKKFVSITQEPKSTVFPDKENDVAMTGDVLADSQHITFLTNIPDEQKSNNFRIVQQLIKKLTEDKLVNPESAVVLWTALPKLFMTKTDQSVDARYF